MSRLVPAVLLVLLLAPAARAELEILPLSKIRKGMVGYGLTVFEGARIERFPVEVVDVVPRMLPKQDIILIRCGGRAAAETFGIAGGMSGSPIYIEGKLVGALAYGWTFTREAIAGVTPIETMIRDTARPLEKPAEPTSKAAPAGPGGTPGIRRLASPLLVSGMSPRSLAGLRERLAPLGLRPMQAGGGGGARPAMEKVRLEPGSSCAIDLMRGDMTWTILGTVTAVDGDRVLAFGHSFFDAGERVWPLSTAWVNYTFGSLADSFKMGETGRQVGALIQDRQAAVAGIVGKKASLIPVTLKVTNGVTKREETYRVEVVRDPFFTRLMLDFAISDALSSAEGGQGESRVRVDLRMRVAGRKEPVVYRDMFTSSYSVSAYGATSMISRLLDNPFGKVDLASVEVLDAEVVHSEGTVRIDAVKVRRGTAEPGETVKLLVTVRPPKGDRKIIEFPVRIPLTAVPGKLVKISVMGGDNVSSSAPTPDDVEGVIRLIEGYRPSTDLVAQIQLPHIEVTRRGRVVTGIPASVLEGLLPSTGTAPVGLRQAMARTYLATPHAIRGSATIQIAIVKPGR